MISFLKLVCFGLNTLVVAPIVVATAWFDQRAAYRVCRIWVRVNLLASGVRIRTRRLARLDPNGAFVFMSNHRSQFDILAVVEALPEFQLRWVAKVELTRVPVFGWALRHTGHIIIDRSDTGQAVESLRVAQARMRDGISVMIFPEGTRSAAGGALLPFKKGGFMMALETGFPIVPLAVRGSELILPKGSWRARSGVIDVIVGEPIRVEGVDRDELMRRVQLFMEEHLAHEADAPGRRRAAGEAM